MQNCGTHIAGFTAFGLLSILPPLAGTALLFMTLGELAIAFSDVVIDGVVVECSRGEDQATAGSLQSICWGSQARQAPVYIGKQNLWATQHTRFGCLSRAWSLPVPSTLRCWLTLLTLLLAI